MLEELTCSTIPEGWGAISVKFLQKWKLLPGSADYHAASPLHCQSYRESLHCPAQSDEDRVPWTPEPAAPPCRKHEPRLHPWSMAGFVHLQKLKNSGFSRAVLQFFPWLFQDSSVKPGMKITFTMNCLKQHLIVNVVAVKPQCAPSVSFQY